MHDPDAWRDLGVHWHCYAEMDHGGGAIDRPKVREERLRERGYVAPDPEHVARWIARYQRDEMRIQAVHLVAPGTGIAALGDDEHRDHDEFANLEVLIRGDSVYTTFPAAGRSRRWLYAEAVTSEECPCPDER